MGRPLVLLVDPDDDTRDIFRTALEWYGYDVIHTGDPDVGLELCLTERPSLVLGDFPLPTKDGGNFVDVAREHPEIASTPILVVTARAMRSELKTARDLGDVVLVKPIVPAQLVAEVERIIGPGDSSRRNDDAISI